jgi:Nitroreductase family
MLNPFATEGSLFQLIRAAQAAPSIHNTQPWSFRIVADDRIELRANPERQLRIADPHRREMVISCGAALFNLRMALRVTGHDPVVWLVPDQKKHPDLLASVEIVTSRARLPGFGEQRLYEAIQERHTNREPFSTRPVPMPIVAELEHAAWREHAKMWLLHRHNAKQVLRVTAEADKKLNAVPEYTRELRQWIGAGNGLGIPISAFGPRPRRAPGPVRDLGLGLPGPRRCERFEAHPLLMVLSTDETNTPLAWLRAGQALQRVLLTATRYGVAASFLTQPFELQDGYASSLYRPSPWLRHPEVMVLRLGYGPPVAATPRETCPEVVDWRIKPPRPVKPPDLGAESSQAP